MTAYFKSDKLCVDILAVRMNHLSSVNIRASDEAVPFGWLFLPYFSGLARNSEKRDEDFPQTVDFVIGFGAKQFGGGLEGVFEDRVQSQERVIGYLSRFPVWPKLTASENWGLNVELPLHQWEVVSSFFLPGERPSRVKIEMQLASRSPSSFAIEELNFQRELT